MRTMLASAAVLIAVAGLGSCARMPDGKGSTANRGIGSFGRQELVVIELRMEGGICKIHQKTPPEIRTQAGATIQWVFVGMCDGGIPIEIKPELTDADGKAHTLFDLTDKATRLVANAPATDKGPPMRLSAKVISSLTKGRYKYELLIDGKPAHYNFQADRGDFLACPIWPCGDFDTY